MLAIYGGNSDIAEFLTKNDALRFRAAMIYAYNFDKSVVHGITDAGDLRPNADAIFNWHGAGLARHIQATELMNGVSSYNDTTLSGSLMKRLDARRTLRPDWANDLTAHYLLDYDSTLERATDVNTYKLFLNLQYKPNVFPWEMDV